MLRGAAEEIQNALRSMHACFAADSEDVQREWVKLTQKVRNPIPIPIYCITGFQPSPAVLSALLFT